MSNENPNIKNCASQRTLIKQHLQAGHTLTALQALRQFGCARLASRIDELRQSGMPISTEWLRIENAQGKRVRVARYRLVVGEVAA